MRVGYFAAVITAVGALTGAADSASADQVSLDSACQGFGAERGDVITLGNGTPANLCWFEDARACTLEALQAGNCLHSGRKTTGFATEAARYCAWLDGTITLSDSPIEGLEEIDGTCELPDGSECLIGRLYYGTCG